MGSNYENGMYNQLMEVMARLDAVENKLHTEKWGHKKIVERLNAKIDDLTHEDQLLRDDSACLKSILNNDSFNTLLPSSIDQKVEKLAYTHNGRKKSNENVVERKEKHYETGQGILCGKRNHRLQTSIPFFDF